MVWADLTRYFDTTFLSSFDEHYFLFQGNMRDVNRSIVERSKQDPCRHGPGFSMQDDRIFFWVVLKMRHPERHIVQAQFAKCGVEVHLQGCRFGCEPGKEAGIIWSRAHELGVITVRFLSGSLEG